MKKAEIMKSKNHEKQSDKKRIKKIEK